MTKAQASEQLTAAMRERGTTFSELANRLEVPPVWLAAAIMGQHPFPEDKAALVVEELEVDNEIIPALVEVPTRGALDEPVPTDPTIYRLYEVLQVYGPALKALINEEFGDGIMSAINFKIDLDRVPDPAGDRVRITLDGKFLPYQWG